MKAYTEVKVGDSIVGDFNDRLMVVTDVVYQYTFLSGDTNVFDHPYVEAKLANPESFLKNKVFHIGNQWRWSAIHQPPVEINKGLGFDERII